MWRAQRRCVNVARDQDDADKCFSLCEVLPHGRRLLDHASILSVREPLPVENYETPEKTLARLTPDGQATGFREGLRERFSGQKNAYCKVRGGDVLELFFFEVDVIARVRKFLDDITETFWIVPGLMVLAGLLAAIALVDTDRSGLVPPSLLDSTWLYNGGSTGARTLLGAVASSTIGVAGTVFSITIAALSLAAGQMGPRLLRNFTSDRGNQVTLGTFLGTFAYSLMVLRSVRGQGEGEFVPHLALTVAILLALSSVGTLVYFVGHMSGRLNVETVVQLVSEELLATVRRLSLDKRPPVPPDPTLWDGATVIRDGRSGYLQQLDGDGLADWATEHGTAIRLLIRPGDYVFPGAPIAAITPAFDGVEDAIRDASALGRTRVSSIDIESSVRQLTEVAVRALSPGINDPETAMGVLDRLGGTLCELGPLHLPSGVTIRDGRVAVVVPNVDYDGLVDAMFHMIRQNAAGSTAVLLRMLEVLTSVLSCETDPARIETLQRHANLVLEDADREIPSQSDRADVHRRYRAFMRAKQEGPLAAITDPGR